ncbi:carboxylic ester hydrolase [Dictyobacter aurantiacus]|uniref:Carboxylic ester hydrolase n=2 Tax=Dictyobacter aurantiacus TaxID=1936993 RepID=A0A401ZST5_9CHLR|nr:carboxylic ester hydrolase [Dictyobacter aurantiacus]
MLIMANLLTFVVFVVPRLHASGWTSSIVLVTFAVAGFQILVEGPRWQMVPAYVLTGLLLLVWGVERLVKSNRIAKDLLSNRLVVGGTIILCLLDLLLAASLPIVFPVFHFPRPSGPYQIGTLTYHWVESRHEIFSTDPNAHRELMVQVWYPVKGNVSSVRAPYVQDASALSASVTRVAPLPWFAFNHFQYVTTNAIPSARVATDTSTYPVLVFLTGIFGFRQSNTFQIENFVSHGYIVVGIDQPYTAAAVDFPDGHQIIGWTHAQMDPFTNQSLNPVEPAPMLNGIALKNGNMPYLAQDVSFTLDQLSALNKADPNGILTGRLDLKRVGTFGISLGAMVAAEACHIDSRLKACLMVDAAMPFDVVQVGLRQPGMWLTRPANDMRLEHWKESDITQTLNTMQAVFNKEPAGEGYYVSVPGMFHVNFTDAPYFTPLGPLFGFTGPINAQRGFDIVNAYSLAFFEQHLQDHTAPLLDGPSKYYPEVIFSSKSISYHPFR